MKTKLGNHKGITTKLASVFAAGALSDANAASSVMTVAAPTINRSSVDAKATTSSSEVAGDLTFKVLVRQDAEPFGEKEQRRFRALATKEALGSATAEEMAELERLDEARRSAPGARTTDEILAEYRRRQMVLAAKEFFDRHVHYHR